MAGMDWDEIEAALQRGHRAANRDEQYFLAASYWNDGNPPPDYRYAERQPTRTVDLRPSVVQMARSGQPPAPDRTLDRVVDLLERIAAKLGA